MPSNANRRLKFKKNLARDARTGKWHVRVRLRGRRIQKGGFPSRESARMFLEHQILRAAGVQVDGPVPTLEEAVASYFQRLRLLRRSPDTMRYYEVKAPVLTKALGNPPLDRILQEDIEDFVKARGDDVTASTINKELNFLRTLHHHAEIEPLWAIEPLSAQPKRRFVHSRDVVLDLWETLSEPTRVAVGLCMFTGIRQKTAYEAEASWVHGPELWVPHSKTGEAFKTHLVGTLTDILPTTGSLVRKHKDAIRSELVRRSKKTQP